MAEFAKSRYCHIAMAFTWGKTPEGYAFWSDAFDRFIDYKANIKRGAVYDIKARNSV